MNLLAISDLHLNPATAERNSAFLEFLSTAQQDGDEVLILGDLFDLWMGPDALTFPFQRPILSRMKELAAQGLKMEYVEGNRDFYLSLYAGTLFQTVHTDSYRRQWGTHQLHVEHGDWINVDDWPYRTFRRATKNRFARFLIEHLPPRWLQRGAERLEKKMRGTNLKYKLRYPEEHCRNFVERQGRTGADLVIIGHFHDEKAWDIPVQEKNVLFYNLPGWEAGFRYLVIPQDGRRPHFSVKGRTDHGNSSAP